MLGVEHCFWSSAIVPPHDAAEERTNLSACYADLNRLAKRRALISRLLKPASGRARPDNDFNRSDGCPHDHLLFCDRRSPGRKLVLVLERRSALGCKPMLRAIRDVGKRYLPEASGAFAVNSSELYLSRPGQASCSSCLGDAERRRHPSESSRRVQAHSLPFRLPVHFRCWPVRDVPARSDRVRSSDRMEVMASRQADAFDIQRTSVRRNGFRLLNCSYPQTGTGLFPSVA